MNGAEQKSMTPDNTWQDKDALDRREEREEEKANEDSGVESEAI